MRRFRYILFILLSVLLTACDKVPVNGKLEGMWQLMEIISPAGIIDVKSNKTYISFQLNLSQWQRGGTIYYAHFNHTGDYLVFYDMYSPAKPTLEDFNDHRITQEEIDQGVLAPWGVHTLNPSYVILELTSSHMTLFGGDTTLKFRKF